MFFSFWSISEPLPRLHTQKTTGRCPSQLERAGLIQQEREDLRRFYKHLAAPACFPLLLIKIPTSAQVQGILNINFNFTQTYPKKLTQVFFVCNSFHSLQHLAFNHRSERHTEIDICLQRCIDLRISTSSSVLFCFLHKCRSLFECNHSLCSFSGRNFG